jgi:pimeloyl-ACP methyl ester carboxylesterase
MPYRLINRAQIYYNVYGERKSVVPIRLIHGSTMTAESEWRDIVPALAEQYFMIAPDCRGHGKSSNPNHSYSFSEMAGDMAMLVNALGFEKVHVIGHSNGGNVALVYLRSAVILGNQAIPRFGCQDSV